MKKIIAAVVSVCIFLVAIVQSFAGEADKKQSLLLYSRSNSHSSNNHGGMSNMAGIPPFITMEMLEAAIQTQEEYGYPASVCIAQAICESGFGRYGPGGENGQGLSGLAYNYKNLFGIKGTGPAGSAYLQTQEQLPNGTFITIQQPFRAYHSYTECIYDRAELLKNVYSDLIEGTTTADEFALAIAGRWATAHVYGNTLLTLMRNYDLYRLDSMTIEDLHNSGSSEMTDSDIVSIGLSQVGNVNGEPYWSWMGFSSRVAWCACFVSWCADRAGLIEADMVPKTASTVYMKSYFTTRNRFVQEPAIGAIIFFDWNHDGVTDHVGIVINVANGYVETVEGNTSNSVKTRSYPLSSSNIMGYGVY